MKNRFQPGPKQNGEIQRGKRTLPHDYGMDKFDRDMLRVGCIRTASERKQAASLKKALRHGAASFRQVRMPREKKIPRRFGCARAGALLFAEVSLLLFLEHVS